MDTRGAAQSAVVLRQNAVRGGAISSLYDDLAVAVDDDVDTWYAEAHVSVPGHHFGEGAVENRNVHPYSNLFCEAPLVLCTVSHIWLATLPTACKGDEVTGEPEEVS